MAVRVAPTDEALDRAVRQYIADCAGLDAAQVVPGNDNAPAPAGLYATALLVEWTPHGLGSTRFAADPFGEDDLEAATWRPATADYSVQFFRDGAHDRARRFSLCASAPLGRAAAAARNLTLIRAGGALRLDALVTQRWERRAVVDLRLGFIAAVRAGAGCLTSAAAAVNYEGAAGRPHEQTLEINLTED